MKSYEKVDVPEAKLEHLVRQHASMIEEDLVYVDHQKPAAGGRLDVLLVDSGRTLVVAELKIVQDDGMLLQGVDYYDYISNHVEALARLYKSHNIDPTQQARLFLIAPSFSQTLVNRCKWIDLPVFLFTFHCLKFNGDDEIVPIFSEHAISSKPTVIEITTLSDHFDYITDPGVRAKALALIDEIKSWNPRAITIDAIKYSISIKINGRVLAYLHPRRKYYILKVKTLSSVEEDHLL